MGLIILVIMVIVAVFMLICWQISLYWYGKLIKQKEFLAVRGLKRFKRAERAERTFLKIVCLAMAAVIIASIFIIGNAFVCVGPTPCKDYNLMSESDNDKQIFLTLDSERMNN